MAGSATLPNGAETGWSLSEIRLGSTDIRIRHPETGNSPIIKNNTRKSVILEDLKIDSIMLLYFVSVGVSADSL
jgi:hypothetical protein